MMKSSLDSSNRKEKVVVHSGYSSSSTSASVNATTEEESIIGIIKIGRSSSSSSKLAKRKRRKSNNCSIVIIGILLAINLGFICLFSNHHIIQHASCNSLPSPHHQVALSHSSSSSPQVPYQKSQVSSLPPVVRHPGTCTYQRSQSACTFSLLCYLAKGLPIEGCGDESEGTCCMLYSSPSSKSQSPSESSSSAAPLPPPPSSLKSSTELSAPSTYETSDVSGYHYPSHASSSSSSPSAPYPSLTGLSSQQPSAAESSYYPTTLHITEEVEEDTPYHQQNYLTSSSSGPIDRYQHEIDDLESDNLIRRTPVYPLEEDPVERTQPDTSATVWTSISNNVARVLPSMRIKSRFNQGCVGGTKCSFFLVCWMSGGSLGSSCGPLYTCCVTPSSQDIQPAFYGPVVNDPYCGRSSTRISRVVGGNDATFGLYPWQAFVQVGGSRCGGALVGPRHVVTAGHCVARSQHNPTSIRVTLGDYILHSDIESLPHEVFTVVEVRLHPNFRFTPQADRFDVAVLILDRNANYQDNIKPICLPQKDANFLGRTSYVAGWGALQAGSKLRPKVLQHVAVPVIENHVCEGWHRKRGINIRIHDEMMCAGYEFGGRDACQGDSGGPLMLNDYGVWYLIGIVSAGYSCAKQYQPGIYHRVSSSSDWISANVFQSAQPAKR